MILINQLLYFLIFSSKQVFVVLGFFVEIFRFKLKVSPLNIFLGLIFSDLSYKFLVFSFLLFIFFLKFLIFNFFLLILLLYVFELILNLQKLLVKSLLLLLECIAFVLIMTQSLKLFFLCLYYFSKLLIFQFNWFFFLFLLFFLISETLKLPPHLFVLLLKLKILVLTHKVTLLLLQLIILFFYVFHNIRLLF